MVMCEPAATTATRVPGMQLTPTGLPPEGALPRTLHGHGMPAPGPAEQQAHTRAPPAKPSPHGNRRGGGSPTIQRGLLLCVPVLLSQHDFLCERDTAAGQSLPVPTPLGPPPRTPRRRGTSACKSLPLGPSTPEACSPRLSFVYQNICPVSHRQMPHVPKTPHVPLTPRVPQTDALCPTGPMKRAWGFHSQVTLSENSQLGSSH